MQHKKKNGVNDFYKTSRKKQRKSGRRETAILENTVPYLSATLNDSCGQGRKSRDDPWSHRRGGGEKEREGRAIKELGTYNEI